MGVNNTPGAAEQRESNDRLTVSRRATLGILGAGGLSAITSGSVAAKGRSPRADLSITGIGSDVESDDGRDVWVDGDYAYTGGGYNTNALVVWDISDPTNPTFEAMMDEDLEFGRGVVVRQDIAYVSGRDSGSLVSVDVSDPSNPTKLDSVIDEDLEGARGVELTANGKYAFVALGLLGGFGGEAMAVIDITDPSNMYLNQRLDGEDIFAGGDVHRNGNHVFMSGYQEGSLMVFDISDPAEVDHVTTYSVGLADARGLSSRGKTIFINSPADNSVVALDISDPSNISEISRVSDPVLAGARGNSIKGSNLFVSGRSSNRIVWLDISNSKNIAIVDSVMDESLSGAYGSFASEKKVFAAAAGSGDLTIADPNPK